VDHHAFSSMDGLPSACGRSTSLVVSVAPSRAAAGLQESGTDQETSIFRNRNVSRGIKKRCDESSRHVNIEPNVFCARQVVPESRLLPDCHNRGYNCCLGARSHQLLTNLAANSLVGLNYRDRH